MKKTRLCAIIIGILFLILFYSFVWAQENREREFYLRERAPVALMVLDVAIVRPLSACAATGLTVFYVGISPLAYSIGVGEQSARIFVEAPWRFTAMRPLGDFDNYRDGKSITYIELP